MGLVLSATSKDISAQNTVALPTFAEAMEAHKAMVFSIAWHCLRDRACAEELAQDVFLELHRHWAEMKSADHIVFWLRRVMSNRCIDAARKRRNHREMRLEENIE